MSGILLPFCTGVKCSVPCKIPAIKCPIYSLHVIWQTTKTVIPLSQHYTATMNIVILWSQAVKFYDKASFVLYSKEIQCTSLKFIKITVTVF